MGLFGKSDEDTQLAKEQRKQAKELVRAEQTRHIDVFTIPNLPDRSYTPLGMVSAEVQKHIRILSNGINIGLSELIEELKKQTRKMGGDAVLGFNMNTVVNQDKDHWATSYAFGTAIAYGKRDQEE